MWKFKLIKRIWDGYNVNTVDIVWETFRLNTFLAIKLVLPSKKAKLIYEDREVSVPYFLAKFALLFAGDKVRKELRKSFIHAGRTFTVVLPEGGEDPHVFVPGTVKPKSRPSFVGKEL